MLTILVKVYCVNVVVDIKPIYLNKGYLFQNKISYLDKTCFRFAKIKFSKHTLYTVAENWHMISFFNFTFCLFSFVISVLISSLIHFVHFSLFSFCLFSLLNSSYSFLFHLIFFHFILTFWNETKWKPRGRELT